MADFFTMEAGDYLERLDGIVSPNAHPDAKEFVRIARALRGSALMANQNQVAAVAGGLEGLARAVHDARLEWDEAARQLAIRAVDDLKVLVRAIHNWSAAEDARAQRIATELEQVAGVAPTPGAARGELDAGTRAFIAREGAAIGSALDQAARTLAANPTAVRSLDAVVRATQPLRGIASLADLPPLPDLLDSIELAIHTVQHQSPPPDNAATLFDAAARATSRAAREIAGAGQADPDAEEAVAFSRELGAVLDLDPDVVPIETLFHDDDGPHTVEIGQPTAAEAGLGQVELISHAEHLKGAADDLERATSEIQRQLRAQGLAPTLIAMAPAGNLPARLAFAARDAIARGAAINDVRGFAAHLREAGLLLAESATADESATAERLNSVIRSLRRLAAGDARATAPASPIETAEEELPEEELGLAASYVWYARHLEAWDGTAGTLDEFLAGPPTAPVTTPAAPELQPEPVAEPSAVAAADSAPDDADVPSIADYCYSGRAAIERALSLRPQITAALAEPSGRAEELIEEVFDLVELGLE